MIQMFTRTNRVRPFGRDLIFNFLTPKEAPGENKEGNNTAAQRRQNESI